ncbi:hypothetical protein LCGC14_1180620 [marine sediment metagenome]|uniref:Uncharacterized protein n=1 Tax=marine sediment metagenome TaxID=412755 RepID=A0A0F9LMB1_9ZZZZ
MYNIIIIYGQSKTGKTRLAKLVANLTGAVLADDSHGPGDALAAHLAFPLKPLVLTVGVAKSDTETLYGSSWIASAADIIIHMPSLSVMKDRYNG